MGPGMIPPQMQAPALQLVDYMIPGKLWTFSAVSCLMTFKAGKKVNAAIVCILFDLAMFFYLEQ